MELSAIWNDGMVLQRGRQIPLIGTTEGEWVRVRFRGKTYEAAAGIDGNFEVLLDAQDAGGPYDMELEDGNIREISNILIGDIWLLGGQSNMSLPIARTLDCTKAELEGKREFNIRMFQVPEQTEFQKPTEVLQAGDFSAAGYFFARELVRTYGIPIGLLQTAVGGTPVEAWMSEESLKDFKTDYEMLWQAKDATYVQSMTEADTARIEDWFCRLNRSEE
ncbi:MAG: sialate O-acetylesterase, partial [Hungatella sp.]